MFRSKTTRAAPSAAITTSFNPCSRGCFARSSTRSALQREGILVSILVLVDVSLEDPGIHSEIRQSGVSILVLVDVSLEEIVQVEGLTSVLVSILVLVDVSLEG